MDAGPPALRAAASRRDLRLLAVLVATGALLRLLMAAKLGLGIDESYMVAAGRTLHLGYYDHPPLAWWLSRGAALALGSEAPLAVRLPFVALFCVSTLLVYRLGVLVDSPRAGLWAAVALNLAPVLGITTGTWVLPDGPLIAALLGAAYCLLRALPAEDAAWGGWLGAGACCGLAGLSKYSAVLVAAGAGAYLLASPLHRSWLGRPQPWVAAALAGAMVAPVVAWNASHGWASFAFQAERALAYRFNPAGPLVVLGGEALFLLPWIWAGLMAALVRGLAAGTRAWQSRLLCCLALPPIVLFATVALWSHRVLFHWAVPGYVFLFPLLGVELERLGARRPRLLACASAGTVGLVAIGLLVAAAEIRWNWLGALVPGFDPGLQALDWTPLRGALAARGLLQRPGTVIAGTSWWDTGKLDYALGGAPPVLCFNTDARQFGYGPGPAGAIGEDVLLLAPNLDAARVQQEYGRLFASIDALAPVRLDFPGRAEVPLAAFLGHRLLSWP
jgi:hypothetical protein